jgi:transposase
MDAKEMAKALSKELREKIVGAYERGAGTIDEVAAIFAIHPRTVAKYLQIKRDSGDLTPKPLPGRPPILNDANLKIIKAIILSKSDGTLQEYCDLFKEKTDTVITIVSMHNACKKLNFRRKKRVTSPKKGNAWTYKKDGRIT